MPKQYMDLNVDELVVKLLAGERDLKNIRLPNFSDLTENDGYQQLQDYLKSEDFEQYPLDITGSVLMGINAPELHLPYLIGNRVKLLRANLSGSCFSQANLEHAHFVDAKLYNVDLSGANLSRATLGIAELKIANLSGAKLYEAQLSAANLISADLTKADLTQADVRDADLSNANLSGAYLIGTNFDDTILFGANLVGADLESSNLRGALFTRADLRYVKNLELAHNVGTAHYLETKVTQVVANVISKALEGFDGRFEVTK